MRINPPAATRTARSVSVKSQQLEACDTTLKRQANTRNAKNKDPNMQTHPYLRRMYAVRLPYPYLAVHPYLLTVHPQKVHSAIVLVVRAPYGVAQR
eukprot:scaffold34584_cov87-Phaeocystis_antarctica.AAC.7